MEDPHEKPHMKIYSPRWGHDDYYQINFDKGSLTIQINSINTATVEATWDSSKKALKPASWRKDLFDIMASDHIYPPRNLPKLLEYIWQQWKDKKITTDKLQPELDALADYVNAHTRKTLTTVFWTNMPN